MTCKDRIRLLDITMKSLSATVPSSVPVYISNDGTQNAKMVEYLTTSNEIEIDDWTFPVSQVWVKQMGVLPNYKSVKGISGKANVVIHKTIKGVKHFTDVVRLAFLECSCSHVIKVQDDAVFKDGWYHKMCQASQDGEFGIISGFRHFFGRVKFRGVNTHMDEIAQGNVGGVLLMISKMLCEKKPVLFENNIVQTRDMDDFWVDNCRKANVAVGVLKRGVCQHIGYKSEIYKTRKHSMINEGVIGRCDKDLFPPYEITDRVKVFK